MVPLILTGPIQTSGFHDGWEDVRAPGVAGKAVT